MVDDAIWRLNANGRRREWKGLGQTYLYWVGGLVTVSVGYGLLSGQSLAETGLFSRYAVYTGAAIVAVASVIGLFVHGIPGLRYRLRQQSKEGAGNSRMAEAAVTAEGLNGEGPRATRATKETRRDE